MIGDPLTALVRATQATPAAPAAGEDGAAQAASGMSALDFIQAGGSIGYVIVLLSFVAATLAVVHLVRLRSGALVPEQAVADLGRMLAARRVDDAIAYCEAPDNICFLTNVMRSGLLRYKRSPFGALELKSALEEAGQEQVARLSRSTDGLALVASIAPMLGLLGTVVGINGAFATISSAQGFSRPDQLAGDISLALVTTIMGLVLAIPATSAVTYFRNRIEQLAAEAAVVVDELAIFLEAPAASQQQQQQPSQPAAPGRVQQTPQPPAPAPREAGTVPAAPIHNAPRPPRAARPDAPNA